MYVRVRNISLVVLDSAGSGSAQYRDSDHCRWPAPLLHTQGLGAVQRRLLARVLGQRRLRLAPRTSGHGGVQRRRAARRAPAGDLRPTWTCAAHRGGRAAAGRRPAVHTVLNVLELGWAGPPDLDLRVCVRIADLAPLLRRARLTSLTMDGCSDLVTDDAAARLAGALRHLSVLNLSSCDRVMDAGSAHLAKLPHLASLGLECCDQITDVAWRTCASSGTRAARLPQHQRLR